MPGNVQAGMSFLQTVETARVWGVVMMVTFVMPFAVLAFG